MFLAVVVGGLGALGATLFPPADPARDGKREADRIERAVHAPATAEVLQVAGQVDEAFRTQWAEATPALSPAAPAEPLTVARRLSLALAGTIPSLEEIRWFQKLPALSVTANQDSAEPAGAPSLDHHPEQFYLAALLDDPTDRRFAEYFAERLARAYVGTENGPFLLYRRRRFVTWLADQIHAGRPYDQIVQDLIQGEGLWTDNPATNFLTATIEQDNEKKDPSPERMAARVSRAFLGIRLDCAHCHDHPFERWKQTDFSGLAAFFGQTRMQFTGLREAKGETYQFEDQRTGEKKSAEPAVPVYAELLPEVRDGHRRESLARWVTHSQNKYFAQATVNRVWALLFGRGLVEPVDDLSTVLSNGGKLPPALEILAADFAQHHDLKRLVKTIAATEVFRQDSAAGVLNETDADAIWKWSRARLSQSAAHQDLPESVPPAEAIGALAAVAGPDGQTLDALLAGANDADLLGLVRDLSAETRERLAVLPPDAQRGRLREWLAREVSDRHEQAWAVFPLTRLRPEQVAGGLLQSAMIETLDHEMHIVFRLQRFGQTNEFVERYGDTGDAELERRGGTIPQRLLMMNGNLVKERTKQDLMNAAGRIAGLAGDDRTAVETSFLTVLSRKPSAAESAHFEQRLQDKQVPRNQHIEDLFWTLLNTTEFSWNH